MAKPETFQQLSVLISLGHYEVALNLLSRLQVSELNIQWRRNALLLAYKAEGTNGLRQELERHALEGQANAETIYFAVKLLASEGQAFVKDGDGRDCVDWLRKAVCLAPKNNPARTALAFLLSQTGKPDYLLEAEKLCKEVLEDDFSEGMLEKKVDQDTLRTLARTLRNLGDSENSVKYSRSAVYASHLSQPGKNFISDLEKLKDLPAILVSEDQRLEVLSTYSKTLDRLLEESLPAKSERARLLETLLEISNFYIPYLSPDDLYFSKKYSQMIARLGVFFEYKSNLMKKSGEQRSLAVIGTFAQHSEVFIYQYLDEIIDSKAFRVEFINIGDSGRFDYPSRLSQNVSLKNFHFNGGTYDDFLRVVRARDYSFVFFPEVGMSPESRFLSFHRLAPLQFTSWLHPSSTASNNIDLFFSGEAMEPPESSCHYTEKLVSLSGVGQSFGEFCKTRSFINNHIKAGRLICIQSAIKIQPYFDEWIQEILDMKEVAEVIFIDPTIPHIKRVLQQRLGRLRKTEKISFVGRMTPPELSTLLESCEVALDLPNWAGGNTTIDCLRVGLPVVAYRGERMRSRHTFGIYEVMGISKLLTADSRLDYMSLIIKLLTDSQYQEYCRNSILTSISSLNSSGRVVQKELCEALVSNAT